MRKPIAILAATAAALMLAGPAHAMGSGNPYEDMQVGVTYTVYSPTFTAGLNVVKAGGNTATAPGIEQNFHAEYGKQNGRSFSIDEGNPLGFDMGLAVPVMTTKVQGQTATVYANCDDTNPSAVKRCKSSDVSKLGGYLKVTLPAAQGLRPTIVIVETEGPKPLAAQQLVQIAKGLQPITS